MDAVNLYQLSNIYVLKNDKNYSLKLKRFYQEISSTKGNNSVKENELDTIYSFVNEILDIDDNISVLDDFFCGFSIPHISKEFDLLKLYKSKCVINIELKSQLIDKQDIEKQLLENRFYLSHLKLKIYNFTYVMQSSGKGIVFRLSENGLEESSITDIYDILCPKGKTINRNIEELFSVEKFLISPFNDTEEFWSGHYFLTDHQRSIKEEFYTDILYDRFVYGLSGEAGTGKSLLIYDLAREICKRSKVCIIHCGYLNRGHKRLNTKSENLDIIDDQFSKGALSSYDYIFIDEAHRLSKCKFNALIDVYRKKQIPMIFAYDYFQVLTKREIKENIPLELEKLGSDFKLFKLRNTIRINDDILYFINKVFNIKTQFPKSKDVSFENIDVIYVDSYEEAYSVLEYYKKKKYMPISYSGTDTDGYEITSRFKMYSNTHHVLGQDFDNIIVFLDNSFHYSSGGLEANEQPSSDYLLLNMLYENMSRAVDRLAILIIANKRLYNKLMEIKLKL
jgi:hypothetical protein